MPKKPTLYLDTNIFSALHFSAREPGAIARRDKTSEWWELERFHFELYSSQRTEFELRRGAYSGQKRSIAEVRRIRYLAPSSEVKEIAKQLIDLQVLPAQEDGDAAHLGFCIHHEIDYLLTWNYAHFVNADAAKRLARTCAQRRWHLPSLVSPETVPWISLGGDIERT